MKMHLKIFINFVTVLLIITVFNVEGRKTSRGRSSGSSRGSSRRSGSNAQPVPTSFSNPQASAPKPSLFGWQEKPAQKTQTSSRNSKPTNTHSYPSSNTGLSGNTQAKQPPVQQEHIQRNSDLLNAPGQVGKSGAPSHAYPASNSLSGNLGTGSGYPQGSGLSGSGYPQGSGLSGSNGGPVHYSSNAHNVQSGVNHPTNNMGNNYNNPQGNPPPYYYNRNNYPGAPPPYTSVGNNFNHQPPHSHYIPPNHGGYGGHGSYNTGFGGPQMPGYFGNYGGGKGFGGVSRTSSALTGVGIAGAGVGTILTGLALWNLARSTGRSHHTVIYDNRGQPVAVEPDNSTAAAMNSILGDLVNCTLTINNENVTEVLAIPCAIATSFTSEVDIKTEHENTNENDKTKCTITVVNTKQREFDTTIPCSVLLNSAAENNVTEPPMITNSTELGINTGMVSNENVSQSSQPSPFRLSSGESDHNLSNMNSQLYNCTLKTGETPDPINPCFPITHNLTVIPLQPTEATDI